jgi:hypothetical protein
MPRDEVPEVPVPTISLSVDAPAVTTPLTVSVPAQELQLAPEVPKAGWFFMKNSEGQPSVSMTFATIAFVVTTLWLILSMFVKIGPVEIRQFDPLVPTTYMLPLITMYVVRRYTDARYGK